MITTETLADNAAHLAGLNDTEVRQERERCARSVEHYAAILAAACGAERAASWLSDVEDAVATLKQALVEEQVRELIGCARRADARHQGEQARRLGEQGKLAAVCKQYPAYRKLAAAALRIKCRLTQAWVLHVLAGGRENANDTVTELSCEPAEWTRVFIGSCASMTCDREAQQYPAALAWLAKRGIAG